MVIAQTHERLHRHLLERMEAPVVRWIAQRMPSAVTPDHLTLLALGGTTLTVTGYIGTRWHPACLWLASAGLIIHWLGDTLDGSVARLRHCERPRYGFFIDHACDTFTVAAIIISIGLSPLVRLDIAGIALCGYFLMACVTYLVTLCTGRFQLAYGGVGPTEFRAALVAANTVAFMTSMPHWETGLGMVSPYDVAALCFGAGGFASAVVVAWRTARLLRIRDPRPQPGERAP